MHKLLSFDSSNLSFCRDLSFTGQNPTKITTNFSFNLCFQFFVDIFCCMFVFFRNRIQNLMVLFLLSHPKEMLVKLCEFLVVSPFLVVVLINSVTDLDRIVDNFHDELSVIAFFLKNNLLISAISVSYVEVVTNVDFARKDKVVFCVVDPIHSAYELSHTRSASGRRGLRISISQVDQNIVEHAVQIDYQLISHFLQLDISFNHLILFQGSHCLSKD